MSTNGDAFTVTCRNRETCSDILTFASPTQSGVSKVRITCCLRHDPRRVGWAKAAPTYRLIPARVPPCPPATPTVGTAEHAPCPTVTSRPPLPILQPVRAGMVHWTHGTSSGTSDGDIKTFKRATTSWMGRPEIGGGRGFSQNSRQTYRVSSAPSVSSSASPASEGR